MLAKEHLEIIEGRQWFIAMGVLDYEEEYQDASIYHYGSDSNEEDGSGLVGEVVIEVVEDMKYYYLLSYMLKPSHLLTHGFDNNITAQDKLFKCMCNFGAQAEWKEGRIVFSSYVDVETTKDQCCLLNTKHLDYIIGYTMEDAVGDKDLKRMPHTRLNFIDGSISSYCSVINSPNALKK